MNLELTITPQIVHSSDFPQAAIEAIVNWYEENKPDYGHLDTLRDWRDGKKESRHLPVIWGSSWACDVPLYLTLLTDMDLDITGNVIRLLDRQHEDHEYEWHRALATAEAVRDMKARGAYE